MLIRRHHCRMCGDVFCSECTSNRAPLASYGIFAAVRVCNACYGIHSEQYKIVKACVHGDTESVKRFITFRKKRLTRAEIAGLTDVFPPILCAAKNGHHEIVRMMLEAKADSNARVEIADCIMLLCFKCREINCHDSAASEHRCPICNAKIMCEVPEKNKAGMTPLHAAMSSGAPAPALVKMLLEASANPAAKTMLGITPLMLAVDNNQHTLLEPLVQAKADLHDVDMDGRSVLHFAENRDAAIATKLIELGCTMDVPDNNSNDCSGSH